MADSWRASLPDRSLYLLEKIEERHRKGFSLLPEERLVVLLIDKLDVYGKVEEEPDAPVPASKSVRHRVSSGSL